MNSDQIRDRLLQSFAGADIQLSDTTGGGDHWSCRIVSEAFEGLSPVGRHQAVYAALGDWILGDSAPIHALQLSTYTPAQTAQ
jgi:stress-induced morphogen